MELFEKALSLEEAAGREDEAFIRKVYPEFAEEYLKKVKSLREIIEA